MKNIKVMTSFLPPNVIFWIKYQTAAKKLLEVFLTSSKNDTVTLKKNTTTDLLLTLI